MNTQTYTKGQAIRVDGKSGFSYINPCGCNSKCRVYIVRTPDGDTYYADDSRITPEVPKETLGIIACNAASSWAGWDVFQPWNHLDPMQRNAWEEAARKVRDAVLAEVANPVYNTLERMPTKEDANTDGFVEAAKYGGTQWMIAGWGEARRYDVWRRVDMPPAAPVEPSKEEKAFEAWAKERGWEPDAENTGIVRQTWLAALEYAKSAK